MLGHGQGTGGVVILGDFNFQPWELHGGEDPSRRRRDGWRRFQQQWHFHLLKPMFTGSAPNGVKLPFRDEVVQIHPASTRHGHTAGRAIDLALWSPDVTASLAMQKYGL